MGWEAAALQPPCSPQTRANPLFFGQKLNFSGRCQQPKIVVFIKRKKTEFILSSKIKFPKSGIFTARCTSA